LLPTRTHIHRAFRWQRTSTSSTNDHQYYLTQTRLNHSISVYSRFSTFVFTSAFFRNSSTRLTSFKIITIVHPAIIGPSIRRLSRKPPSDYQLNPVKTTAVISTAKWIHHVIAPSSAQTIPSGNRSLGNPGQTKEKAQQRTER